MRIKRSFTEKDWDFQSLEPVGTQPLYPKYKVPSVRSPLLHKTFSCFTDPTWCTIHFVRIKEMCFYR